MDDIIATDKQIEQILQQIAVIPEQVADGIVVIDLAGTVRFFNPAWVAMHGCDANEELIGMHISEFHTKEQMKILVADFIEETKRRGQLVGPVEHMRSDGTVFCSQTKMSTVRDKEGKTIGLVVFATNTTQPANAQRHLSDQTIELTAANQQLQQEVAKRKQLEEHLSQQTNELTAARKQIRQTNTEQTQTTRRLSEQSSQLKTIEEQLQQEFARRIQAKENLAQLQARLNILLVNICKLNQELSLTCLKKGTENQKV